MPKHKRPISSPEALAAIKQAREQGIPLSETEAKAMRGSIHILKIPKLRFPMNVHVNFGKHGEYRYWLESQPKGPGRTEYPLLERLAAMEEAFRDQCISPEARKREGLQKATLAASAARTANSKEFAILLALSEADPKDRTACTKIAKQFDVKPAHVRKLRAKRASP